MAERLALEVQGLTKRFGRFEAVSDLSLRVAEGHIFGFLGPNGAGKTTAIRMMLGLIEASAGATRIFGRDVRRDYKRALRQVGAMVEGPAFYGFLSARRNLKLFGGVSGGVSGTRVDEVLGQVGLGRRGDDKVASYSKGMRQRLGIALALLESPPLLVLDEPTNGLDPQGVREVRQLLRRIRDERGTTVFLSSHLLGEMEQVCDRVAIVAAGRLLREGPLDALLGGERAVAELEVALEHDARACAHLEMRLGVRVQLTRRGHLELPCDGLDLADLNRSLVEEGIAVRGLGARRRTLEECFVALTGASAEVR